MNLVEIASLCGASHGLNAALAASEPSGFSMDSRSIKPGELFIAIIGERVDGHQFVQEVLDRGACAALVIHKRLPFATSLGEYRERLLFVTDTVTAIQQMALRVIEKWNRPIVGVTASAGKTTTKDLTAHVLEAAGHVFKSLGNLNTGYGLPLTLGRMLTVGAKPDDYDIAVFEMGMNSYGEIRRLTEIAPPSVSIVGNVGTAHIEFFGSREAIARAKGEIVDGLKPGGMAILNADDALVNAMAEKRNDIRVVRFGIEATDADVSASRIAIADDLSSTRFLLSTPQGKAEVMLPLIGRHNVYNALAAAAAGHCFKLTPPQIAAQLATAAASKMRGEILRLSNGVTIVDDSYNSNPQALIEAVRAVASSNGFKRRIVVAGEMLELGEQGAAMHEQCGREIATTGIEMLIGVRGLAQQLVEGAIASGRMNASNAVFTVSPEEAGEMLANEMRHGDLILVKGSRGVRTEKVVEKLRAVA
jgi:UDP-N-acetylmuramoyl-tripeptide--D-alanyl-D-alanine ligase